MLSKMTLSSWHLSAEKRTLAERDVCILGGGIVGASLAWWLRRTEPKLRVAVVEARFIGAGASGRNAGMVLAGLADHYDLMVERYGRARARAAWQATLDHQRWLRDFVAETNADVELDPCGSWRTALLPDEREHLARSAELLRADGFEAEYVAHDPLGAGFHGALGVRSDMGVHPVKLVRALLEASGADVFEECEADAIEPLSDGVGVRTRRVEFRARCVFIALNAYAGLFHPFFKRFIAPHRGQVLVTAPVGERLFDRLIYAHHGYIYFRQLRDGRVLLGGFRHLFREREATSVDETTPEVQGALEDFLRQRFPKAAAARVEARWAGIMDFSPDGLPVIGRLPESERVMYVVGFTGHGFGLALEVARRAVNLWRTGAPDELFGAERF